jgi:hypothetical protein
MAKTVSRGASGKRPSKKKSTPSKPASGGAKQPPKSKPAPKKATAKKRVPSVSPSRGKTIAWYFSTLPAWQRKLAEQITRIVADVAPKAKVSVKWAQPVWEHQGPFAWLKGQRAHVSFGFWRGAELRDPSKLLEGEGTRMRHLKIRQGDAVPESEISAFVRQAIALNDAKGDPTARR